MVIFMWKDNRQAGSAYNLFGGIEKANIQGKDKNKAKNSEKHDYFLLV